MVWAPFLIALSFGLVISGALWFIFVWPGREPADEDDADDE